MKKLIFLPLFGLIFLAGCWPKFDIVTISPPQTPTTINTLFESPLPLDTGEYIPPKIMISQWTWTILAEFGSKIKNEVSRTATEEDKQNGRKWSIVSWYLYTYTYKDLWIKITSSVLYEPYFSQKTDWIIFKRYKNIIYNARWPVWGDHIAVFTKNPQTALVQEIEKNHLGTWCKIETGVFDKQTAHYGSMIGFVFAYIQNKDRQTTCTYDIQFPQREMPLVFVMNPKKPNKYYKIATSDGCAPGPCSIFGNIEFF